MRSAREGEDEDGFGRQHPGLNEDEEKNVERLYVSQTSGVRLHPSCAHNIRLKEKIRECEKHSTYADTSTRKPLSMLCIHPSLEFDESLMTSAEHLSASNGLSASCVFLSSFSVIQTKVKSTAHTSEPHLLEASYSVTRLW